MNSYAPPEVCDAIYSGVNGAKYDSGLGQWVVPCDAEIDMAIQIKLVSLIKQESCSCVDPSLHSVMKFTLSIHWTYLLLVWVTHRLALDLGFLKL